MYDFINSMDELTTEMECALDNLFTVYSAMESDKGLTRVCVSNAIFASYRHMRGIHERMAKCGEQAWKKYNEQQSGEVQ